MTASGVNCCNKQILNKHEVYSSGSPNTLTFPVSSHIVWTPSTNGTFNLPIVTSSTTGAELTIYKSNSASTITINRQSTNVIYPLNSYTSVTTYSFLATNTHIRLKSVGFSGGNYGWEITNGGRNIVGDLTSDRIYMSAAASTTPTLQLGNSTLSLAQNYALGMNGNMAINGKIFFYYNWTLTSNNGGNFYVTYGNEGQTGGAYCTPGGVWTNASDRNLKTNIEDITFGLNEILQLKPVSYNFKKIPDKRKQLGFIAQELMEHIPTIVEFDEGNDGYCVSYTEIIPILTKAIQEQNVEIQELKTEIQKIKEYLNIV